MSIFDSTLPDSWSWAKVSDHFRITKRRADLGRGDPTKDVPFVPMAAVPAGGAVEVCAELRPRASISSGNYFERGDLLLSRITPSFENLKQAIADKITQSHGFASTELIPIQPSDASSSVQFLFYYVLHPDVRDFLVSRMEGATGRQRVPERAVLDLAVPLPPSEEQQGIVAILSLVRRAIENEEKSVAVARELKLAALERVFARGLRQESQRETELGLIPSSWEIRRLGDLGHVGNGSTPLKGNKAYWTGGSIPWITSAKVYDVTIASAEQFVTPLAVKECHLPLVPAGSVVIAITGQGKTLGHVAVTAIDTCVNQHIAYVKFNSAENNPHFVRLFLETKYDQLRAVALGGGSTKGALTCAFLKTFMVPTPPREEQDQIAAGLMSIESAISAHERRWASLRDLFSTLLSRLMAGEIRVDKLDIDASAVAVT